MTETDNQIMNELENTVHQNWKEYSDTFDDKINEMWNFIMYSDFNNKEIIRLNRDIRFLKKDLKAEKRKVDDLEFDLERLDSQYNRLEKKHKKEDKKKVKFDKDKSWFTKEKSKPKNYVAINENDKDKYLKDIFSKLDNINDIINLKNEKHKYDFFKNEKFKKLYMLIPSLERLDKVIGMKKVKKMYSR